MSAVIMSAAGLAGVAGARGGFLDWFLGWDRSWTITVPGVGWVLTGRAVFLAAAAAAKAMRKASCHRTTRWARDQGIHTEAKPATVARLIPPSTSPARTAGTAQTSTMRGAMASAPGRSQAIRG